MPGWIHPDDASDIPDIEVIEHNIPSPHTPLGSKGKGEGPTGMAPGALGNAIDDALAPLDVTLTSMPFTRADLALGESTLGRL